MSGRRLAARFGVRRCASPALVAAGLLLNAAWQPVEAQAPGYPPIDPRSVRAEYRAEVLERINENLARWGDAWASDRVDDLVDLYWEDALLIPPNASLVRGREALRGYFESVLPAHGHIEAFMLDFDAAGGMSQVFGNYMLGIQRGEGAGTQHSGPMLTVYMLRGRTWRIRSQIFMPSEGRPN